MLAKPLSYKVHGNKLVRGEFVGGGASSLHLSPLMGMFFAHMAKTIKYKNENEIWAIFFYARPLRANALLYNQMNPYNGICHLLIVL